MSEIATFLPGIPKSLRDELVNCYKTIGRNYVENRWEPAELNGGKFCEIVFTIIEGYLHQNFPTRSKKPKNMVKACQLLEQVPIGNCTGDRSCRILIPRILIPLYEIRNNRGVGHVGGDVNPNFQDATTVLTLCSWILAELVRIFHDVTLTKAELVVASLLERKHPLVWELDGTKRVLSIGLTKVQETLLLLYTEPGWVEAKLLAKWVEYSNESQYRSKVLRSLHKQRFIEYCPEKKSAHITPLGIVEAENSILHFA